MTAASTQRQGRTLTRAEVDQEEKPAEAREDMWRSRRTESGRVRPSPGAYRAACVLRAASGVEHDNTEEPIETPTQRFNESNHTHTRTHAQLTLCVSLPRSPMSLPLHAPPCSNKQSIQCRRILLLPHLFSLCCLSECAGSLLLIPPIPSPPSFSLPACRRGGGRQRVTAGGKAAVHRPAK